jgi:hypothetical protein
LPKKIREDVEKELDGLIADMLEERGDGDIRAVLTELGTPAELAAKYSGDEQKFLISGVYYINYIRVLKLVIPIVCGAVLLGLIISTISDITAGITESPAIFALRVIGQILAGVIGGAWQSFAIITVVFAVLERTKTNLNSYGDDFLESLPDAPQESEKIGIGEPIFGIIFSVAVAVLFLGVPQAIGGMFYDTWIPLFDVAVLRSMWLPIIAWAVLGIIAETVTIMEGRYTKKLAGVCVVTNLLIAACAAAVFLQDAIMNPAFVQDISAILNYEADWLVPWLSNANIIIFAIVCIAIIIESISISVKAMKYDR